MDREEPCEGQGEHDLAWLEKRDRDEFMFLHEELQAVAVEDRENLIT